MPEMTSKTVTVSGKEDVILALPLIREALHAATFAKIEIDTDCVTLYIDVDVKALVQSIECDKATAKCPEEGRIDR